jgi:hypothetical protein
MAVPGGGLRNAAAINMVARLDTVVIWNVDPPEPGFVLLNPGGIRWAQSAGATGMISSAGGNRRPWCLRCGGFPLAQAAIRRTQNDPLKSFQAETPGRRRATGVNIDDRYRTRGAISPVMLGMLEWSGKEGSRTSKERCTNR